MSREAGKQAAAEAALQFIEQDMVIGVGTGSLLVTRAIEIFSVLNLAPNSSPNPNAPLVKTQC